jgi:hypothetical protein
MKKIRILNINEESMKLTKNKNQKILPSSFFFNKLDYEINKKILTAGNSLEN